jgi:type III secretory pathway component EscV
MITFYPDEFKLIPYLIQLTCLINLSISISTWNDIIIDNNPSEVCIEAGNHLLIVQNSCLAIKKIIVTIYALLTLNFGISDKRIARDLDGKNGLGTFVT